MSEFEILVLMNELSRTITEQFNFWMATTFAVVVASYTAGERLSKVLRICIAALYLVACIVFFFRYLDALQSTVQMAELLREMGSNYSTQYIGVVSYSRRIVMLGGSVLAILLIFKPTVGSLGHAGAGDT